MKLLNKNHLLININFTNTNVICTVTDMNGKTLTWASTGKEKIKGMKKITTSTILVLAKYLYVYNIRNNISVTHVKIKGINKIKTGFIKQLKLLGLNILTIQQKFNLPHGGCKNARTRKL